MAATKRVYHRKFGSYSGSRINGVDEIAIPSGDQARRHVSRAYWLTTKVETGGTFGSSFCGDGTAKTEGPDQHIGVYPKELAHEDWNAEDDQGGLWAFLQFLEPIGGSAIEALWAALAQEGWYISQDGFLRYLEDGQHDVKGRLVDVVAGDCVYGAQIRDTFTPIGGKVPKSGPKWEQCKKWSLLFNDVFSDSSTFEAQIKFGVDHLVNRVRTQRIKLVDGQRISMRRLIYGTRVDVESLLVGDGFSKKLDLAMCVLHSHSVNAPSIAYRKLAEALDVSGFGAFQKGTPVEMDFVKQLLRSLANSTYGRWNDEVENGRWSRTRKHAKNSGLWPEAFFTGKDAIMPSRL